MAKTQDSQTVEGKDVASAGQVLDGGQELVQVRSSTDLQQVTELERILLTNERQEVVDDPEQIAREIMQQLLSAESDDELDQVGTAIGWRELENVPVELAGFKWRPSDFEEGSSVFFVVFGTRLDTGERVVLTTGARNVLAQLVNMAKRQTLVGKVVAIVKADRPTKQGFVPYWLRFVGTEAGGPGAGKWVSPEPGAEPAGEPEPAGA